MNEDVFWKVLDEILNFGEFIIAVTNPAASANIVGKISVGRDGKERVVDKEVCHCHVHIEAEKIDQFHFTFIDVGFGKEPCCELKTRNNETVLKLYLRGNAEKAKENFAQFSYKDSEFVKGNW